MPKNIFYRSGYKYRIDEEYSLLTSIKPEWDIVTEYYSIETTGLVTAREGYMFDGATNAIDTSDFMRGALIHDIGCQAILEGRLPENYKAVVDRELIIICGKDGMSKLRQWYVYKAVNKFSCTNDDPHPLKSAPDRDAVNIDVMGSA